MWLLQRWQAWLRFLKTEKYPNHKFIMIMNPAFHVFIQDFINVTVDLPEWFKELNLETDCYEAPPANSIPGSLTSPSVYSDLLTYVRSFYNPEKAIELWPPRGVNTWIDQKPQLFARYMTTTSIPHKKPIICLFPRGRSRSSNRNVPEYVWRGVVDALKENFFIVLGGTPSGSSLVDYPDSKDVINLIPTGDADKLDKIITYLNHSICSISSQSGLTHVSLLAGCPTYIIGHEKDRHCVIENRLDAPTSFRYVYDYRAIDVETIVQDVSRFLQALQESGISVNKYIGINRPALHSLKNKKELIGVEIGTFMGDNALNILENLDIKKLYLIDPYALDIDKFHLSDKDGKKKVSREEKIQFIKQAVEAKLEEYKDKIVILHRSSTDAINDIKEDLDFIYIDGEHKYEGVKSDIELYYQKLKLDGVIGGHDYDEESPGNGVKKAVHEFVENKHLKLYSEVDPEDEKSHDWWCFNHIINRAALRNLQDHKNLIGAEIGVDEGDNALNILENLDIKKLYLIDPYQGYMYEGKPVGEAGSEKHFQEAKEKLKKYEDKIVWIRKPSVDAITDIEEDLDFVYIDGDHRYNFVMSDIFLYYDIIKAEGLIGGDNYEYEDVYKAVNKCFAEGVLNTQKNDDVDCVDWWCLNKDIYERIIGESNTILVDLLRKRTM